jgi:hypothetical protein
MDALDKGDYGTLAMQTPPDPRVVDHILKHLERETSRARDPFEPRAPPRSSGSLLS